MSILQLLSLVDLLLWASEKVRVRETSFALQQRPGSQFCTESWKRTCLTNARITQPEVNELGQLGAVIIAEENIVPAV